MKKQGKHTKKLLKNLEFGPNKFVDTLNNQFLYMRV